MVRYPSLFHSEFDILGTLAQHHAHGTHHPKP